MRRTMIFTAVGAALLLCGVLLYRCFARSRTAKAEQQVLSDTARLYAFFWNQSSENADAAFMFSFTAAKENEEAEEHRLCCTFRRVDGECIEHEDVPVNEEQWGELEAALRKASLPPYSPPDPHLADTADSRIEICKAENGDCVTEYYNGEYAHELHAFLMTFIERITA